MPCAGATGPTITLISGAEWGTTTCPPGGHRDRSGGAEGSAVRAWVAVAG